MAARLEALLAGLDPAALRAEGAALLIAGPTGAGKSALAEELADRLPCEIVSVDSCAVYRRLDIGSAKPSAAVRAKIPHHLIDILDPDGAYSAGRFFRDAAACVAAIQARGRLPLLVGGTMMYVNTLLHGLDEAPAQEAAARAAARQMEEEGSAAVHAKLAALDPAFGRRVGPNDSQRIGRALAIHLAGGPPARRRRPPPFKLRRRFLVPRSRSELRRRVELRFMAMIERGLVAEVEGILADYPADIGALRSVGYRQVVAHLQGKTGWEEALRRGRAASSQLVRRQLAWLRRFAPRPEETVEV
ncbi:MAG: tRNA (adenosine(37)-N6)-dimethylallyltransferase MiaA [Betaproteobacteria bacterium AqS2]|uniref:tRNA dimethylallyltransferase n=1 Tax=Candidatus Amphirhobacter heronislandensis TaxID=1732024 RepID=A0A930UF99_9GAMM|nr:tRNA (adenosine(37)-N6)-dimethylallyltransferase MiaA [Betaproteobacteria bacterium AqS2]